MNIPAVEMLADTAVTRSSKLENFRSISCSMGALSACPGQLLPTSGSWFGVVMVCLLVRARIIACDLHMLSFFATPRGG